MKPKQVSRKHTNSEYLLCKCPCCEMAFYRRLSTIRGNDPTYYNKFHYKRFLHYRERKLLTKRDLRSKNCTKPASSIVWLPNEPKPYILLKPVLH